jgi:hypothetical protein
VAAIPPEMSRSEEFVIWMSSTAMNAPKIVPKTPIHFRASMTQVSGVSR